jgi:hypothetical protein
MMRVVVGSWTVDTRQSRYVTQSPDTSEAVDRFLMERYRKMTPSDKMRMVTELNETVEAVALTGLRMRYPDAPERELRLRLAAIRYGRELVIKAFGWDPDEHG